MATETVRARDWNWTLLGVLCFARALAFAARTHVVPFYLELMDRMGVSYIGSGMIYSAYMLTYALTLTPAGVASDRYSPRAMLGGGLLLMGLGTLALAVVPWYWVALVARMVQGVGTSMAYTCAMKLVATRFPHGGRGRALAAMEVVIGLGMLLTLTVFPILTRWTSLVVLFSVLGLSMLAALLLVPLLPRTASDDGSERAGRVAATARGASPRLPDRSILGRPVYLLTTVAFLGLFPVNGFFSWLPTYFSKEVGLGKEGGGWLMAILLVSEMVSAPFAGIVSDRLGRRLPAIQIGGVALALACLAATSAASGAMPYVVAILAGVATGWAILPLQALATEVGGPARAGLMASLTSAAGQAGGVVAGVVFGWMVDVTGSFRYVWALGFGMAVLRVAVASLIRESPARPMPATAD